MPPDLIILKTGGTLMKMKLIEKGGYIKSCNVAAGFLSVWLPENLCRAGYNTTMHCN